MSRKKSQVEKKKNRKGKFVNWDKEFFDRLMAAKGFRTQKDFARFLGVHESSLSQWIHKRGVSSDAWHLIFTKCEEVDLHWALTGKSAPGSVSPQKCFYRVQKLLQQDVTIVSKQMMAHIHALVRVLNGVSGNVLDITEIIAKELENISNMKDIELAEILMADRRKEDKPVEKERRKNSGGVT